MAKGFKPKILKRVTVPVLKMKPNRPYYLRFEEPIHEGEKLKGQKYDNAAQVCMVLNFETGEINTCIARTVMKSALDKNYPDNKYVGKSFEIIYQNHPNPDIKYKLFTISEIAEPSPEDFNPTEEMNDEQGEDDDQGFEDGHDDNADGSDDVETLHSDHSENSSSEEGDESLEGSNGTSSRRRNERGSRALA